MKKLLSLSLGLALVYSISLPARAELIKNLKTDASIEVRSFGIDNETDRNPAADDYRSETRTRIMVGGAFDLLDDVHSKVVLSKNNRIYGANGTGQGENLNTVQSNVTVDNAFLKIDKVFGRVDLTLGRQFYGRPDDLVIYYGPNNDDILSINSLDLIRADGDVMGWAKLTGIYGKRNDAGGNVNSDQDVFGAEANTDKLIPKGNLAVYYYTRKNKGAAGAANDTLNVYGVRAAGDLLLSGLTYQVEAALNGGRNRQAANVGYNGNALLVGLKYGREVAALPVRLAVEAGKGTNDFQAVSAGRRFGIIWGEHSNVGPSTLKGGTGSTGLSNLKVVDASIGVDVTKKLGVDASWYRFQKDDAMLGTGAGLSSLGTEYDLVVSWKHSDNVYLEANAASLQVGDALKPAGANAPITRLGGDVKIKF